MKITNPNGPNTTILMPGSCNAACDFCFWNRNEAKIKTPDDYLQMVFQHLDSMPAEFRCLSISGGEPTLSPYLPRFLTKLARFRRNGRYDRVVLTTHGGNLASHLALVATSVDHINISRHSFDDAENYRIFDTERVPSTAGLKELISIIHETTECDVTLNCVIQPDAHSVWCKKFIDYARQVGADAVAFRKVAGDTKPTTAEHDFVEYYGVESDTKCPVCRTMFQYMKFTTGEKFPIYWKGSVAEPSIQTGGIYEAVIHPDGGLYADWGMNRPIVVTTRTITELVYMDNPPCKPLQTMEDPAPKKAKKVTEGRDRPSKRAAPPAHGCGSTLGCGGSMYNGGRC